MLPTIWQLLVATMSIIYKHVKIQTYSVRPIQVYLSLLYHNFFSLQQNNPQSQDHELLHIPISVWTFKFTVTLILHVKREPTSISKSRLSEYFILDTIR